MTDFLQFLTNQSALLTFIATCTSVVGLIYMIIRNIKNDLNNQFDNLNKHIDRLDARMNTIDERMFYLATGKTLVDIIKDERMKELKHQGRE